MSLCNCLASSRVFIFKNSFRSSANNKIFDLINRGRSFMKSANSNGDNIEASDFSPYLQRVVFDQWDMTLRARLDRGWEVRCTHLLIVVYLIYTYLNNATATSYLRKFSCLNNATATTKLFYQNYFGYSNLKSEFSIIYFSFRWFDFLR